MKTTTTNRIPNGINGITWMFGDTWERAQAVQRMEQQCSVSRRQVHSDDWDNELDPVRSEWDKTHPEVKRTAPIHEVIVTTPVKTAPLPIPRFQDIVRQQESTH